MEKELLYRFFDGKASAEDERRVLEWLGEDPAHREELLAERRVFDALLMHARPSDPARQTVHRGLILPPWVRRTMRYAAAIAVAASIGATWVSRTNDKFAPACTVISVPAGQHVDVTLPDGTQVCMNALSELRYPAFFTNDERRVELKGEAFFDVTHDENRPFVVETYACNVEVLGTKFDVEARAEAEEFTASLVEGRVRVVDKADSRNRVELQPDHRVLRTAGRLVVEPIPDHERFRWREGLIVFRDASFRGLLREFEKCYGVRIEVEREPAGTRSLTGKIRIAEGIDHALWILQRNADFEYVRNETRDVIYIR